MVVGSGGVGKKDRTARQVTKVPETAKSVVLSLSTAGRTVNRLASLSLSSISWVLVQICPSYHPDSSYSTVSLNNLPLTWDHPSSNRNTTTITTKSDPQVPAIKNGTGSDLGSNVAADTGKLIRQNPVHNVINLLRNSENGRVAQSKKRMP